MSTAAGSSALLLQRPSARRSMYTPLRNHDHARYSLTKAGVLLCLCATVKHVQINIFELNAKLCWHPADQHLMMIMACRTRSSLDKGRPPQAAAPPAASSAAVAPSPVASPPPKATSPGMYVPQCEEKEWVTKVCRTPD